MRAILMAPELGPAITDFIGACEAAAWRSQTEMMAVHPNAKTFRDGVTEFPLGRHANVIARVDYAAKSVNVLRVD